MPTIAQQTNYCYLHRLSVLIVRNVVNFCLVTNCIQKIFLSFVMKVGCNQSNVYCSNKLPLKHNSFIVKANINYELIRNRQINRKLIIVSIRKINCSFHALGRNTAIQHYNQLAFLFPSSTNLRKIIFVNQVTLLTFSSLSRVSLCFWLKWTWVSIQYLESSDMRIIVPEN